MRRLLCVAFLLGCDGSQADSIDVEVRVVDYSTFDETGPIATPQGGALVAFGAGDDIQLVIADANGIARATMAPHGSITATHTGNPFTLVTLLDVSEASAYELSAGVINLPPEPVQPGACDFITMTTSFRGLAPHAVEELDVTRFGGGVSRSGTAQAPYSDATTITLQDVPDAETAIMSTTLSRELIQSPIGAQPARQTILDLVDGCATTHEVDATALLPWVGMITKAGTTIDVPLMDGSLEADYQATYINYLKSSADEATWLLYGPQAKAIELPRLPSELADLMPPNDALDSAAAVLVDLSDQDGYDATVPIRYFQGPPELHLTGGATSSRFLQY
jgi:hypothetical protein